MRVWLPRPRAQRQALGQGGAQDATFKLDTRRLWLAVSATAFVLLVVIALTWAFVMREGTAVAPVAGTSLPSQGSAPDFELTSHLGQRVHLSELQGRVVLVNFFYAECPGFCSLMNFNLRQVHDALDEDAKKSVVFLSITLDPVADTPAKLQEYAQAHGFSLPQWHFLTGTAEEVEGALTAYGIPTSEAGPVEHVHADGTVHLHPREIDHLAQALLIDQEGEVRKAYLGVSQGEEIFSPQLIAEDIRALIASQQASGAAQGGGHR